MMIPQLQNKVLMSIITGVVTAAALTALLYITGVCKTVSEVIIIYTILVFVMTIIIHSRWEDNED